MKIIITEEQKKKLFIPRKITGEDSRYIKWNKEQTIKNGKPINQYTEDGVKIGYWEEYYSDGELDNRGSYLNGNLDGIWEFFHENGKLWSKGMYKNDKEEGIWKYYKEDGELYKKELYKNGKSIESQPLNESEQPKKGKLFVPRKIDERKEELKKELINSTKNMTSYFNISEIIIQGRIDDYDEEISPDNIQDGYTKVIIDGKNYFGFPKVEETEEDIINNWEDIVASYLNSLIPQSSFESIQKANPNITGRMFKLNITPSNIKVSFSYDEVKYSNRKSNFTIKY